MSSAAPLLAPPTVDPALQGHYEGLEDPVVLGCLAGHPGLVPLLAAAIPHVERAFGPDARIHLSTETESSGAVTLYATILAALAEAELLARFERFSDAWWLHQDRSAGRLVFDVGPA